MNEKMTPEDLEKFIHRELRAIIQTLVHVHRRVLLPDVGGVNRMERVDGVVEQENEKGHGESHFNRRLTSIIQFCFSSNHCRPLEIKISSLRY